MGNSKTMVDDEHHRLLDHLVLLGSAEAAEMLGVSVPTLAGWRHTGFGPLHLKVGRLVKYLETDLRDWLRTRARTGTGASRKGK
jgi:predicted DNA-binding transcriptional regulator AlpA